jgi:hypothetical protein
MKSILKKLLLLLIVVLIGVQFIPKDPKNQSSEIQPMAIEIVHTVPDSVLNILKNSCFVCNSNNTNYPWYANIQPADWWLNDHIVEGKDELNFSEFGSYALRRQFHKLKEIEEQVEENEMPLESYTIIHQNAALSATDKQLVTKWAANLMDSFQRVYPADSLQRKKKTR